MLRGCAQGISAAWSALVWYQTDRTELLDLTFPQVGSSSCTFFQRRNVPVAASQLNLRISSDTLPQSPTRILNSWKEIASYLGRGVRTVQRYEEKLGLPIHRPAGTERSAVLAFADELEQWLRNSPSRNGTHANSTNGDSSTVIELQENPIEKDVRSQLERAKQEMERAHAEYRRTLENYNALKRRVKNAETSSPNGKLRHTG